MKISETLKLYCLRDAHATHLAADSLDSELEEYNLTHFYNSVVQPLANIVVRMNSRGVYIDVKKRDEASQFLTSEIEELQREVDTIVGKAINVRGDDFGRFLFDELKLQGSVRSRKTGKWSTDDKVLIKVRDNYPNIASLITTAINLRQRKKKIGTYLSSAVPGPDGRVKPSFRIGPTTGRLSCKRPNFQNIPDGVCREVYCAAPGKVLVYADYSQVELRIFAVLAQDEILMDAFKYGKDIHTINAHDLYGVPLDQEITKSQRDDCKTYTYGLLYGADESTLATNISSRGTTISVQTVKEMSARFFAAHPKVYGARKYIEDEIRKKRRLVDAFGRPRIFFGSSIDKVIKKGYNFPMQAGAAGIINKSIIKIEKEIPDAVLIQVHDCLMLEVDEGKGEGVGMKCKEIMEEKVEEFGGYSFPVKVQIGENWGEFK